MPLRKACFNLDKNTNETIQFWRDEQLKDWVVTVGAMGEIEPTLFAQNHFDAWNFLPKGLKLRKLTDN